MGSPRLSVAPGGSRSSAGSHPCVYLIKTGLPGPTPTAEEQVGYSIADVVAKAVFGIMIWRVADVKSSVEFENMRRALAEEESRTVKNTAAIAKMKEELA